MCGNGGSDAADAALNPSTASICQITAVLGSSGKDRLLISVKLQRAIFKPEEF